MRKTDVAGVNKGDVLIYTLTTCGWCKKTKGLLDGLGISYSYIDVDLTQGEERESIVTEIKVWNPRVSFPTIVINKQKCIVGFNEAEIKEALGV